MHETNYGEGNWQPVQQLGQRPTPKRATPSSESGPLSADVSSTPTLKRHGVPLEGSKGQCDAYPRAWKTPLNAKEFAIQANRVATMILNGSIDLEQARAYSAVARLVGQSLGIEAARARVARTMPDLSLEAE